MRYLITGRVPTGPVQGLTKEVQHLIPIHEFDAKSPDEAQAALEVFASGTFYFEIKLWERQDDEQG